MSADKHIEQIIENEREWRRELYNRLVALDKKLDVVDKDLSTFKVRVFTFASMIGGAAGISAEFVFKLFKG